MQSGTSCFNKTIFKKNITHFWPIWGIYLVFLLYAAIDTAVIHGKSGNRCQSGKADRRG